MIERLENNKKIIFFDIGGTLGGAPDMFNYFAEKYSDSRKKLISSIISNSFNELFSNKNEDEFLKVSEMLELSFKNVSLKLGIEDLSKFAHQYYKEFFLNYSFLYDDVIEVLDTLREKGIKLIALSDADSDVMIQNLKNLNIYDYFEGLIVSSDLKSYKPSNKIIYEALKYCDIPKSNIFIVGDSKVDIMSGKKMNINTVLINRTTEKIEYQSDYTIKSLRELLLIV